MSEAQARSYVSECVPDAVEPDSQLDDAAYLASGPSFVICLERANAVSRAKKMLGVGLRGSAGRPAIRCVLVFPAAFLCFTTPRCSDQCACLLTICVSGFPGAVGFGARSARHHQEKPRPKLFSSLSAFTASCLKSEPGNSHFICRRRVVFPRGSIRSYWMIPRHCSCSILVAHKQRKLF